MIRYKTAQFKECITQAYIPHCPLQGVHYTGSGIKLPSKEFFTHAHIPHCQLLGVHYISLGIKFTSGTSTLHMLI